MEGQSQMTYLSSSTHDWDDHHSHMSGSSALLQSYWDQQDPRYDQHAPHFPRTISGDHQHSHCNDSVQYPMQDRSYFEDVLDFIKPQDADPWAGGGQQSLQRVWQPPPLSRGPGTEPIPFTRRPMPSDASDSGYATLVATTGQNNFHRNEDECSPKYGFSTATAVSPSARHPSPTLRSTVSDGPRRMAREVNAGRKKQNVDPCPKCKKKLRNRSDAKKHQQTHDRPFRCEHDDCHRTEGFATKNDLERHRKAVHKLDPEVGLKATFVCIMCKQEDGAVAKAPKVWPRKDNFKAHLKRKHIEQDLTNDQKDAIADDIMKRSEVEQRPDDAETAQLTDFDGNASQVDPSDDGGYFLSACANTDPDLPESQNSDAALFGIQGHPSNLPKLPGHQLSVYEMQSSPSISSSQGRSMTYHTTTLMLPPSRSPAKRPRLSLPENGPYGHISTPAITPRRSLSGKIGYGREQGPDHQAWVQVGSNAASRGLLQQRSCSAVKEQPVETSPDISQNSSIVSQQEGDYSCPEPGCTKSMKRECDLKKHIKRHTKPYGCTFPDCFKRFGSRNDWKRHENSQHFLGQMFKCGRPLLDGSACVHRPILHEEEFRQHLQGPDHMIGDAHTVTVLCEEYRLGREGNNNFWCGFCRKVLPQDRATLHAWQVRMNHIGDHFDKDANIDEWVCVEQNRTKEDIQEKGPTQFSGDEDDLAEDPLGFMSPTITGISPYGLENSVDKSLDSYQCGYFVSSPYDNLVPDGALQ